MATTQAKQVANLGFESKRWLAADKFRNDMDAAEYKHVVLGLLFFKYISEPFEEGYKALIAGKEEYEGSAPQDADESRAEKVFWVPLEARWQNSQDNATQPTMGKLIDDTMDAIERDNPKVKSQIRGNLESLGMGVQTE